MCKEPDFDAQQAIAAQSRQLAQLSQLVATLEAKLAASDEEPAASRGAPRAALAPEEEAATEAAEDPRVTEIIDAAPAALRDRAAQFARSTVEGGQVARGERAPRSSAENLRVVGGGVVPPGGFLNCVCIGLPAWGCTGVVVAPQVVLTAAHCGDAISRIMAGGTTVIPALSADARVIGVREVVVHPEYAPHPHSSNDITILILDAPALVPAAPFATSAEIAAASAIEVVGFGYNDPTRPLGLGTKRRATVPGPAIIAEGDDDDLGSLPATLGFHPEYEFVAGRKFLGIDSCNGDSGGPAYVSVGGTFKLAGLTSRATKTALANCGDGGIYVRPEKFRNWIDGVVAQAGVAPIAG